MEVAAMHELVLNKSVRFLDLMTIMNNVLFGLQG